MTLEYRSQAITYRPGRDRALLYEMVTKRISTEAVLDVLQLWPCERVSKAIEPGRAYLVRYRTLLACLRSPRGT